MLKAAFNNAFFYTYILSPVPLNFYTLSWSKGVTQKFRLCLMHFWLVVFASQQIYAAVYN